MIIPILGFLGIAGFVILFIICYLAIDLYYKNYSYELTPEKIVINRGIIVKKSVAIPYGRIQNVNVVKGPIQRFFSIATIKMETAGSSGQYARTEGNLPGIRNPEKLAEKITSQVTGIKRDKEGIGAEVKVEGTEAVLTEILKEIKHLRNDLKK